MAKCRGFLDYGPKKPCPFFDLDNCETPFEPPKCPIKENKLRRPCYRYRCSHDQEIIVVEDDVIGRGFAEGPRERQPKSSETDFILKVQLRILIKRIYLSTLAYYIDPLKQVQRSPLKLVLLLPLIYPSTHPLLPIYLSIYAPTHQISWPSGDE
jgi:hypothetical protein